MVGRQGFSPLRGRPLRRFAPCALRWQTLTRFLSSAPFRVRTRAPVTKKRPTGVDRLLFYGGPSGVQPAARAAAAALRALRAALANAHAFPQLRALSGSNPCTGNKKATNRSRSLSFLWWAVRGSACSAGGRCGASRLARCAGKRSRVSSAPRPFGFEPVHR